MVDNAESFFKYTDVDGDSVEFISATDERMTLGVWNVSRQRQISCYLDPAAVKDLIKGLQRWRGRQTEPSELWCGYGHDHGRHLHTAHRVLSECLGVRGDIYCAESTPAPDGPECLICAHPVTDHNPAQGCLHHPCACGNAERPEPVITSMHRSQALRMAAELWSSVPVPVTTAGVLNTADEFAHWLATGERRPEPIAVPQDMTVIDGSAECPICRHEAHGVTHCGARFLIVGKRTRCACLGVLTA
jgi:hypothetical protein